MSEKPLKLFDQRIIERSLNKGLISESEKVSFLKGLPDDAENMEEVSFEELDNPSLPELSDDQSFRSESHFDTFSNTNFETDIPSQAPESQDSFGSTLSDSYDSDSDNDEF